MFGRGATDTVENRSATARGTASRRVLAASAGLLLATVSSAGMSVQAQQAPGSIVAVDRAGQGTGEAPAGAAISSENVSPAAATASLVRPGEPTAPLPSIATEAPHFDAADPARPSPARSAALAAPSPTEPLPEAPVDASPAAALPAAPSVGNGAPSVGEGTSGGPAPVAPAETAESAFSRQLAALMTNSLPRFSTRPADREALAAFYTARAFQPAFTQEGGVSPLGQASIDTFAAAASEGLDPTDYAQPPLPATADAGQRAEAEMRLAATALLYARHAQSGRFDPKKLSKDVDPNPTVPDSADVLARLAGAPDAAAARAVLASFAPQYPQYLLLKEQLARLMAREQAVSHAPIPPGPSVRPGESDPRVPLLRARLGVEPRGDGEIYDSALVRAVEEFQRQAGLAADGIVGRGTVAALNDTGGDPVPDIIANMERWRWVPHEVAPTYVIVNIPEFMVRIIVDGGTVHETRVVVGKPESPTPILDETMQYVVFNPSWHVPPSIMRNEMLPKLQADPYALQRQGIDVVRNGRVIDPGMVDWRRGTQGYSFRQEPGERNALGRMKFMFPNKHSVYLHDTPSRALFARDRRAFSHGCVRVHEPMAFAEALFALGLPKEGWTEQRLSRLLGGNERSLTLKNKFPIHLVYFTSFVDSAGQLVTREDLYGINAATKAQLGLDGARRFAEQGKPALRR